MDSIADPQAWLSFGVLVTLEIVLGIDNLVFLTLAVDRLPEGARPRARLVGLSLAMLTRVALLFSVVALARLAAPLVEIAGFALSLRDAVLLAGGAFLVVSSVRELKGTRSRRGLPGAPAGARFWPTMIEIGLIDILFSFDSVFGAVGLASRTEVMVAAIVISLPVMMGVAGALGGFIKRHPSVRVLALAFLGAVGAYLLAQGLHFEPPRGYLYAALGFGALVEILNLMLRTRS